ncbi:MAG: hypothetical protein ACK5JD_13255 [Mangrovibacterium sp.]
MFGQKANNDSPTQKKIQMEELDVVKMVKRQLKAKNMSVRKLANSLDMSYAGVWQMLKGDTLRVQRLAELSEALQYNFFREAAEQLGYSEPVYPSAEAASCQALQQRVAELELELKVLKEAISLMRS